jgi:hypothetical protein
VGGLDQRMPGGRHPPRQLGSGDTLWAVGFKIDLPYSGKSPGLYEMALSNFLIGKPTATNALIMFREAGKVGGLPITRQIKWPAGASIADITNRTAGVIGEFYGSVSKVFTGATVEFRV